MPTPFRASYSLGALPALFISSFHLPFRGKRGHPLTDAGTELTEMKVFARDACRGEPERQDPMRLGPAEPTLCTALFSNLDILSTPRSQKRTLLLAIYLPGFSVRGFGGLLDLVFA